MDLTPLKEYLEMLLWSTNWCFSTCRVSLSSWRYSISWWCRRCLEHWKIHRVQRPWWLRGRIHIFWNLKSETVLTLLILGRLDIYYTTSRSQDSWSGLGIYPSILAQRIIAHSISLVGKSISWKLSRGYITLCRKPGQMLSEVASFRKDGLPSSWVLPLLVHIRHRGLQLKSQTFAAEVHEHPDNRIRRRLAAMELGKNGQFAVGRDRWPSSTYFFNISLVDSHCSSHWCLMRGLFSSCRWMLWLRIL